MADVEQTAPRGARGSFPQGAEHECRLAIRPPTATQLPNTFLPSHGSGRIQHVESMIQSREPAESHLGIGHTEMNFHSGGFPDSGRRRKRCLRGTDGAAWDLLADWQSLRIQPSSTHEHRLTKKDAQSGMPASTGTRGRGGHALPGNHRRRDSVCGGGPPLPMTPANSHGSASRTAPQIRRPSGLRTGGRLTDLSSSPTCGPSGQPESLRGHPAWAQRVAMVPTR